MKLIRHPIGSAPPFASGGIRPGRCGGAIARALCWPYVPRPGSGDDIGGDLVLDEGDAVTQNQFALLEPLQAQEINRRRLPQRVDRSIEIAMFLLQSGEFGLKFILGHVLEPDGWWGRAKGREIGQAACPLRHRQDISSATRVKARIGITTISSSVR